MFQVKRVPQKSIVLYYSPSIDCTFSIDSILNGKCLELYD